MLLRSVEITDFLSIKGSTKLLLDKAITVLLGSNDHGKSNLLKALEHLNDDKVITSEEVNWDAPGTASLEFSFRLTDDERAAWFTGMKALRVEYAELEALDAEEEKQEEGEEDEKVEGGEEDEEEEDEAEVAAATAADAKAAKAAADAAESAKRRSTEVRAFVAMTPDDVPPEELVLARRGVDADLSYKGVNLQHLPQEIYDVITGGIPQVELIRSLTGELQDSVEADQLNTEPYEFMQGLFFYAGLSPAAAAPLFVQDDKTERTLQNASKVLDTQLRRLWGQGTHLHFELAHRNGKIEFLADDPAVKERKARMSKRSDGVTQFFRTSIVLNARRKKNTANTYLYLFDEPGVYLHPQGQKDLLQVSEQLGGENQIVYATHSLFMLNQNFPERHRLVIKDEEGTKIDSKAHRANWRLATDALGVFLTSNILFSSHVLFVEGDSDPLYLYEFFRQMNRLGELDVDANRLGIMSFSDVQNLKFLLQVIKRDDAGIQVVVLVDGDPAGSTILDRVKSLCDRLQVKRLPLSKGKSIEDYCFHEATFVAAVTKTLREAKEATSDKTKLGGDFDALVRAAWEARKLAVAAEAKPAKAKDAEGKEEAKGDKKGDKDANGVTTGRWFNDVAKELIGDEASKVALARNYIIACREVDDGTLKQSDCVNTKALCQSIADALTLPKMASE